MNCISFYRTAALRWIVASVLCLPGMQAHALERDHRLPDVGFAASSASQPLELPACFAVDCSALELELFHDLQDGRLDRHDLLSAALIACGVHDPAMLEHYAAVFQQFVERRTAERCVELSPQARAAMLLESLHRELLSGGYDRCCTDLPAVFDQGRFNCVSATILWQCLSERFDLDSTVCELPGHMNARLLIGGGPVEVETTCPRWFALADDPAGRRRALQQANGQPAAELGSIRFLDTAGVIAAIYYNRGIDLLEATHYAEAVAANAKAHRLDPGSAIARRNLLATINNWALWLAGQQQYGRACQLLAAARGMAPEHAPFQVNYVALHQQWIDALVAAGETSEARQLAQRLQAERPKAVAVPSD
jgi:tetratricopeptide (TPR) repeat protein